MDSGISEQNCIGAPTEDKTARTEPCCSGEWQHKHNTQALPLPAGVSVPCLTPAILQPHSKGKSQQAGGANQLRVNGER